MVPALREPESGVVTRVEVIGVFPSSGAPRPVRPAGLAHASNGYGPDRHRRGAGRPIPAHLRSRHVNAFPVTCAFPVALRREALVRGAKMVVSVSPASVRRVGETGRTGDRPAQ
ncbi:hypothetical protein GCM10023074_67950 [Microbispora amethystogenes]|uniref:Uncharacterized protein n=1 Tax=Microbispora amethystogenes TaxID=1427754 RepID=A0ABQ4FNN2_9ACTN|nr:hypothetical protein Mam01_65610 [Microbispora amethystogenes]